MASDPGRPQEERATTSRPTSASRRRGKVKIRIIPKKAEIAAHFGKACAIVIVVVAIAVLGTGVAMASDTEEGDEIKALKAKIAVLEEEKRLLEAERLWLEEQKKLQDAQAGPSSTSKEAARLREQAALLTEQRNLINAYAPAIPAGLQGSISISDNQSIEAEASAYRTMRQVMTEIAKKIEAKVPASGTLLILTADDRAAVSTARLFLADMDLLKTAYENHAEATLEGIPISAVLIGAGALAKTASDVMALFRTDTELKARAVSIPEEAVIAELAGQLTGRVLYYPAGFPAYAEGTTETVQLLAPLQEAREKANSRHRKSVAVLAKKISETKIDDEKAAATASKQALEDQWSAIEAAFSAFTNALRSRDATTGFTPLAQIIRGRWLQARLHAPDSEAFALTLRVLHSGGTYVLKKTFWKGTTLMQSGGIIVEYMLFDKDGILVKGGTTDRVREFSDLTLK